VLDAQDEPHPWDEGAPLLRLLQVPGVAQRESGQPDAVLEGGGLVPLNDPILEDQVSRIFKAAFPNLTVQSGVISRSPKGSIKVTARVTRYYEPNGPYAI
jgi:hypothetical protein